MFIVVKLPGRAATQSIHRQTMSTNLTYTTLSAYSFYPTSPTEKLDNDARLQASNYPPHTDTPSYPYHYPKQSSKHKLQNLFHPITNPNPHLPLRASAHSLTQSINQFIKDQLSNPPTHHVRTPPNPLRRRRLRRQNDARCKSPHRKTSLQFLSQKSTSPPPPFLPPPPPKPIPPCPPLLTLLTTHSISSNTAPISYPTPPPRFVPATLSKSLMKSGSRGIYTMLWIR